MLEVAYRTHHRLLSQSVALRSRPAGPEMQHPAISASTVPELETESPQR
jgi:hypothetical protein